MSRPLRSSGAFLVLLASSSMLGVLVCGGSARAGWPPPPDATSADVKDPSNWPNDPDWGYVAGDPGVRKSGQWGLYGFQPDRSPLYTTSLRPAEMDKPAGASLDLAFRLSTGDPRVVVAVLDSGIKWDDDDVREKAFLNVGELGGHKPKHADGTPCGGQAALAGFDCNGDGVLTVSDYADDLDLLPPPSTEGGNFPRGDKNHNGGLDAGDLILNFSDGKDDDGNGYIDDISGWDMFLDENDPYEDTRYYHGSLIERVAAASSNNGKGGVGACPDCRLMHVRVSDTFIADTQSFAKGIVFAVDSGAKVIQCALGTLDKSSFTQRAIEYAWQHDVVVSGSMADEDSRHHNQPNTANYVLQSHAIVSDGIDDNPTTATSEICFDTGTNFGGQQMLSVTTDGASSTASAETSGLLGLVFSYGLQKGITPALSAGEAFQLMTMTADDIDVPESRMPKPKYFWSQPGWDQRFGYGRVNASTALEWVRDGKIPPVVTVTSPEWFENLYLGRTASPVAVLGTISAKRATAFDYVVEWAAGVQPMEGSWKTVTSQTNVAPATTIGDGGAPLAMLDLATIDPTHTPDTDTRAGENDHAFTVRVRAVAHYGNSIGDVPGEYRRTYYLQTDPDLLPGFPIHLEASGESSPKLADLDGDGVDDLVLATADGEIHAWKITAQGPVELSGFPFRAKALDGLETTPLTPGTASYAGSKAYKTGAVDKAGGREAFFATVAVADMDGDGAPEIVGTTFNGTIYVVQKDGSVRAGWPQRMPYVPSCPLDPTAQKPAVCMDPEHIINRGATASPVLADMNKDGKLDVIQAGFDGSVYVFRPDGTPMPGWPVRIHYDGKLASNKEYGRLVATPAVSDVNGDGIPDVLVPSGERVGDDGAAGGVYLIDGRGSAAGLLPDWPVTMGSLAILPIVGWGITTHGVFGDFTGDGVAEAVFHGNVTAPLILPADPGPQKMLGATPDGTLPAGGGLAPASNFGPLSKAKKDTMFPLFAQPSLADMDMDGTLDVIAAGGSLSLAGNLLVKGSASSSPSQFLVAMWSGKTGKMLPGSPMPVEDFMFTNSQVLVDLNNDGYPEAITGTGGYLVRAFDACGREAPGFPKNTGQWVLATAAAGDIDGDKKLDVVVPTRDGWLYAWRTQGDSEGVVAWPSFHHDNRNTGDYGVKLPHGVLTKGVAPLVCDGVGGAGGSGGSDGSSGAGGGVVATGGQAGSGGASTGGQAGASTTGGMPATQPVTDVTGSGCATAPAPRSAGASLLGAASLLLLVERRRRRRLP